MSNSFFQPGEQRAAKVEKLFSTIASRYDLMNDVQSFGLHRYWKRRAVRLAGPKPGERALDVCCGTGDLARGLAREKAEVVAVDFSVPMLRRAMARGGAQRIAFVQADALQLPFLDDSFNVVTVGYGLRNLARWEEGLREMARVARRGARLVVLDFGKPRFAPWRMLYYAYLKLLVPCLGRAFCGNWSAYAYILESLKQYPAQEGVARHMSQLGLGRVQTYEFLGGAMSINFAVKP